MGGMAKGWRLISELAHAAPDAPETLLVEAADFLSLAPTGEQRLAVADLLRRAVDLHPTHTHRDGLRQLADAIAAPVTVQR